MTMERIAMGANLEPYSDGLFFRWCNCFHWPAWAWPLIESANRVVGKSHCSSNFSQRDSHLQVLLSSEIGEKFLPVTKALFTEVLRRFLPVELCDFGGKAHGDRVPSELAIRCH